MPSALDRLQEEPSGLSGGGDRRVLLLAQHRHVLVQARHLLVRGREDLDRTFVGVPLRALQELVGAGPGLARHGLRLGQGLRALTF